MARVTRTLLWGAGLVLVLILAWFSRRVLLLAFAGVLIALVFTSLINQARRFIPLKQGVGVGLMLLTFAVLATVVGLLLAPGLINQFSELAEELPKSLKELVSKAQSTQTYQRVSAQLPDLKEWMPSGGSAFSKVGSVFTSTFDTVAGFFLTVFVALFLAANPALYKNILLNLVPPPRRQDAREIMRRALCTLKYWLLGQFISMCIIGLMTGIAFAICGVPLAASLGVLAGIGEFIPFVGPLAAAIPAALLALSQSGQMFLIVIGVYMGIQFVEGHFVMPLVQKQTVDLPPVLTLLAVFFMGNTFGLLGMFVAAPLTALVVVLVEEVYIKRYLGENKSLVEG